VGFDLDMIFDNLIIYYYSYLHLFHAYFSVCACACVMFCQGRFRARREDVNGGCGFDLRRVVIFFEKGVVSWILHYV